MNYQIKGAAFSLLFVMMFTAVAVAQPYISESFAVNDGVHIEVETSGGSIEVSGTNSDEVRVEMYVKRRGRTLSAQETDLDGWDITIEKQGNTVYAKAKRERRFNWGGNNNVSISFVIHTPFKATTNAKTSGGSIEIRDMSGDQSAKTSGGSIIASQIAGNVVLKTSGGSITVEEVEGFVEANTSGGRIRAVHVSDGINAKTSGGSITLTELSGNVEAKTSGGSIDAKVVTPNDFIDLKTSGGSITISVPKEYGYDVVLDGNRVRADLENFKGHYEKDEMEGTLNGGGTRISARTSGGSVTLRYF